MDAAFMQNHPRHRTNPMLTHLDTQRRCEQKIKSIDNELVQKVVLGQRNALSRFGRMPLSGDAQSRQASQGLYVINEDHDLVRGGKSRGIALSHAEVKRSHL